MCHPAAIPIALGAAQFASGSAQASMKYNQQKQKVERGNRAKLKNYEHRVKKWENDHLLNTAAWKDDVLNADQEHDDLYLNMVDQWGQQDRQLDEIFRQGDQKLEQALIESYENDYAGEGSGITAMRLAQQNARKLGQEKSEIVDEMLFNKGTVMDKKYSGQGDTSRRQLTVYNKIRFPPVQGHAPHAPLDLEAAPSKTGMYLEQLDAFIGGASTAAGGIAPSVGSADDAVSSSSSSSSLTSSLTGNDYSKVDLNTNDLKAFFWSNK